MHDDLLVRWSDEPTESFVRRTAPRTIITLRYFFELVLSQLVSNRNIKRPETETDRPRKSIYYKC